jgi:membrane dipeptidase
MSSLRLIGKQVNFAPDFVASDGNATLQVVADHIDHIAKVAGIRQ